MAKEVVIDVNKLVNRYRQEVKIDFEQERKLYERYKVAESLKYDQKVRFVALKMFEDKSITVNATIVTET